MPTIPQVLDLLLILVLVMFVPIGFWRGALREWLALAGIALGGALAGEWASAWGGDLATLLRLDRRLADFAVGIAFLLGVTLLVGYGGGVALPYRPDLSWPNRALGAALGFANGCLILSGALRIMQRHLFDDAADSPLLLAGVAQFLILGIGWAYLALLAVLTLGVVVGLARRSTGRSPLFEEYGPPSPIFAPPRWGDADEYDAYDRPGVDDEGGGAWDPRPVSRLGEPDVVAPRGDTPPPIGVMEDTAVLRRVPPSPAPPVARAGADAAVAPPVPPAARARGGGLSTPVAPTVVEIFRPGGRSDSRAAPKSPGARAPNGHAADARHTGADTVGAPVGATAASATCPVCGTAVAPRARFCPACGHIIGDAERRGVARWR